MMQHDIRCVQDEFAKTSVLTSQFEYDYVRFLEETLYDDLEHSFNTPKRTVFDRSIPDAYSKKARKLFYAHGCRVSRKAKILSFLPVGWTFKIKNFPTTTS